MKLHRSNFFLTALLTAGALTFLLAVVTRERTTTTPPYTRPKGGEREGEFELFIGS